MWILRDLVLGEWRPLRRVRGGGDKAAWRPPCFVSVCRGKTLRVYGYGSLWAAGVLGLVAGRYRPPVNREGPWMIEARWMAGISARFGFSSLGYPAGRQCTLSALHRSVSDSNLRSPRRRHATGRAPLGR